MTKVLMFMIRFRTDKVEQLPPRRGSRCKGGMEIRGILTTEKIVLYGNIEGS